MQVKHLDHVNLTVRSFEETAAWYARVFGFEVVESGLWRGQPWGVLKAGEAMLCVYEDQERRFVDGDELNESRIHGVNHFALRISDRDRWLETVRREKIDVAYGGVVEWPYSKSWYVQDPTGYEIEVVSWNGEQARFDLGQGNFPFSSGEQTYAG